MGEQVRGRGMEAGVTVQKDTLAGAGNSYVEYCVASLWGASPFCAQTPRRSLEASFWWPKWSATADSVENGREAANLVSGILTESGKPCQAGDDEARLVEWMKRYQAGDRKAFEALHRALSPKLGRFLRWCGPSPSRVEDLVQESFLQIHRSRHTYRPDRPVTPWAFAIANYVQLMDRRSRRSRLLDEGEEDFALDEVAASRGGAESLADRLRLEAALSKVDADQRGCFVLHHVWGFSFEEIGRIFGISRGAAKNRSYRAARVLRDLLEEGE